MGTAVYVYRSMKDYGIFYPKEVMKEPLSHMPLIDMYISEEGEKKKLWVLTNTESQGWKPDLSRSVVHFRNGTCKKWLRGTEKLVKHGNIFYDFRNNKVVIEPGWLQSPLYTMRVDRFVGKKPMTNSKVVDYINHNVKIDYDKRYYDYERDRLNFIIDEGV